MRAGTRGARVGRIDRPSVVSSTQAGCRAADPATIFRVLCDPQGHVSIDSSGMLQSATGEPATAVGDSFVVHMDREALNDYPMGRYDVTVTITTFVPDREIAWGPPAADRFALRQGQ